MQSWFNVFKLLNILPCAYKGQDCIIILAVKEKKILTKPQYLVTFIKLIKEIKKCSAYKIYI